MAQLVKNPPAMREIWVQFLGWEDPLQKGTATHSSIVACRIPWTSPWGHKDSNTTDFHTFTNNQRTIRELLAVETNAA